MSTHSMMPALMAFAPNLNKRYSRALSVYLPVRAEGFDARHYDLVIGHVLRRYRDRLSDEEREVIEREIPRVRARIDLVRPAGSPALAAFADEKAGLLELIRLPAEIETRLEVGPLLLAPIERLLERFPPALIVVVDKEEARVFGAVLGEVFPLEHLVGRDVKRHKAGGSSALSNQRKADNRAKANLTQFVSTIEREMRARSYQSIYIAGPPAARAEFERLLPTELKRGIAGRLSASLDSAHLQHQLRDQIQRVAAAG
jgi:Bacterial archaeo-eukaryotic release factor family 10